MNASEKKKRDFLSKLRTEILNVPDLPLAFDDNNSQIQASALKGKPDPSQGSNPGSPSRRLANDSKKPF